MKLLFLSAGKGERLMPLTRNTPKPLLEVGEGKTIIEHQIESVLECGGIEELLIVVGYRASQIEAKLKTVRNLPIRFIYNPFFDTSNNLISLWMALPYLKEDFILVNGDNLFNPGLLRSLREFDENKKIVMVVDFKAQYDEDDMKVVRRNDQLLKVSKEIPLNEANAESIGMIRFCGSGRGYLEKTLNQMVRDPESKNIFYLAALQQIMDEGYPVHSFECKETDWCEIDFHPDLEFLRKATLEAMPRFIVDKS